MATLPETPQWEDGIYQIEVSDPVLGGPDGLTNRPAKQLASRTLYLKQHVEETGQGLASHIAAADPHSQYAPKNSPVLTGIPTAPTAPQTTNNQQLANTAFVKAAIAALVASSPAALDTLNELAEALGNDPNFATTMTNALANKQPLDNTLTALSGKTVSGLLEYLHLEETVNLAKNALRVSPKSLTVDLNTLGAIDSAGVYAQTLDANATTANHYPINQAGTLVVTPSAYGCQQEYTSFSSGRKFTRGLAQVWNGIDGPWKNWVEFYGTTNKPTASDIGALAGNGVAGEAAKLGVASNSDMQASPGSAELLTTVAAVMSVLPTRAMSSTDYIRIPDKPGGLIIQWGTTPIIPKASWVDVTFPIPFPSSFLSLMAIFKEANSGCIEYRPYSGASLLTGCQIGEGGAAHYSGSNRAIYIAIGQ